MHLSDETFAILENFSSINSNLLVKPGKELRTISPTRSVMARASIEEEVEGQFAIFDLRKFIGCVSLFDEPELVIKENHMEISEGEQTLEYAFAEPSQIQAPPDKDIKIPSPEVEFELLGKDYSKIMKAMSVAGLPEMAIVGQGGKLMIQTLDVKGTTKDNFSIVVGKTKAKFRVVFRAENLKIIPGDYKVSISSKGLAHFASEKVEYWIAVEEKGSKFEG